MSTSTPTIDAYLHFDGQCADAMQFYARTLNGTLEAMLRFADAPVPCPGLDLSAPGAAQRVMHSSLLMDGRRLMACDLPLGMACPTAMQGCALALTYTDNDQAQRTFEALADGGQITMPMQPTFFSERFGMVIDRYGKSWMINGKMVEQ